MREIKFRVLYNGKMLTKSLNDLLVDSASNFMFLSAELMQFTGLKDKNGKEIYEGDILLIGESEAIRFFPNVFVRWHFDGWVIDSGLPGGVWALQERYFEDGLTEIIGNIYENPDLLNS